MFNIIKKNLDFDNIIVIKIIFYIIKNIKLLLIL